MEPTLGKPEPSNADLQNQFADHASEDKHFQDEQRSQNGEMAIFKGETEGALADLKEGQAAMHAKLEKVPTKDDMARIVEEAMGNIIKQKGKTAYAGLLVLAGIVVALTVITGGAKTLLAWIGFNYMTK